MKVTPSISRTGSRNRIPSPDNHEETQTSFNPPIYNQVESPDVPPIDEKERPNDQAQQSRHQPSVLPENYAPSINSYTQSYPENFNLPLGEPKCELIPDHSAVWIVKEKGLRISSLAAAILLNDAVLTSKDITLLHKHYSSSIIDEGPTDPISGILAATNKTVVGVLGGVADYPIAISRIATSDSAGGKREAASFALSRGKGVSRIVGTGIKAPMEFTVGVSQGFHNVPKLWGDQTVRNVEPVSGVSSGFKAAGKGFGLGLYDGITGLVTQPVKGAQEGGVLGLIGGFFKGVGGVVCKPAAGAAGLAAYPLTGFYEEFQKKRGTSIKANTTAAVMQQGWEELGSCSMQKRSEVLEIWSNLQSLEGQNGSKVKTF